MLWLENTASIEASFTSDISSIELTISGATLWSMSSRTSFQAGELNPCVVLFLLEAPQPTWRNVFIRAVPTLFTAFGHCTIASTWRATPLRNDRRSAPRRTAAMPTPARAVRRVVSPDLASQRQSFHCGYPIGLKRFSLGYCNRRLPRRRFESVSRKGKACRVCSAQSQSSQPQ